jgi:phosphatidate cytidylyltransferase
LRLRVVSAAVLVPLALICVWLGGRPFALLLLAATIGLAVEWAQMARAGRASGTLLSAGMLYVLLGPAALFWVRADPAVGRANVVFLLLLVWASDIGAYAAGRAIGGRRLAPRISPGKTVSGAAGGLLAALAVGLVAAAMSSAPLPRAGGLAIFLGVVAQAGDLAESYAKRRFGVKDSGRLIPGHGGLLDRVDALLAVALMAAALALIDGRGGLLWE